LVKINDIHILIVFNFDFKKWRGSRRLAAPPPIYVEFLLILFDSSFFPTSNISDPVTRKHAALDKISAPHWDFEAWDVSLPYGNFGLSGQRTVKHDRKLCSRSLFCFSVSCLFCEDWWYIYVGMWSVVYYIKETVYDWLFVDVIRGRWD
jgi:hypothetical protein